MVSLLQYDPSGQQDPPAEKENRRFKAIKYPHQLKRTDKDTQHVLTAGRAG